MAASSEMGHFAHRADRSNATSGAPTVPVVVVGIDGSDTSWDAFWWACGTARRLSGRAIAVFVVPTATAGVVAATAPFSAAAIGYTALSEAATDQAEHLRCDAVRLAVEQDIDLTFIEARGDPAKELLRIAETNHADLIVVGRSTKARHHIAGSLGRRLVGRREAPIVVVVP